MPEERQMNISATAPSGNTFQVAEVLERKNKAFEGANILIACSTDPDKNRMFVQSRDLKVISELVADADQHFDHEFEDTRTPIEAAIDISVQEDIDFVLGLINDSVRELAEMTLFSAPVAHYKLGIMVTPLQFAKLKKMCGIEPHPMPTEKAPPEDTDPVVAEEGDQEELFDGGQETGPEPVYDPEAEETEDEEPAPLAPERVIPWYMQDLYPKDDVTPEEDVRLTRENAFKIYSAIQNERPKSFDKIMQMIDTKLDPEKRFDETTTEARVLMPYAESKGILTADDQHFVTNIGRHVLEIHRNDAVNIWSQDNGTTGGKSSKKSEAPASSRGQQSFGPGNDRGF